MVKMKTKDILIKAKQKLIEYHIDDREARLLLAYVLKCKTEDLIRYDDVEEDTYNKFEEVLNKRCSHIPYAYIVGHKEFMKLDFKVNENVLIPRGDTEILVEEVIKICEKIDRPEIRILDMCTGSGCIAISLAKYISNALVTAVDISEEALSVANENAKKNNVEVNFVKSDLFRDLDKQKFDIIISNPPYVKRSFIDNLDDEVKDNEPIIALDGGEDGLDFYKVISNNAREYLKQDGILAFEIGYDEATNVSEILVNNGFKNIRVIKDYSNRDRDIIASY